MFQFSQRYFGEGSFGLQAEFSSKNNHSLATRTTNLSSPKNETLIK
ncbi:MAG: hypothetical protein LBI18_04765 [Planctomycetaceae bacterium]|nr:hypothetical protein [Planctomycetaceae bacterium]